MQTTEAQLRKAGAAVLISNTIDFKARSFPRDENGGFVTALPTRQKDRTIVNYILLLRETKSDRVEIRNKSSVTAEL